MTQLYTTLYTLAAFTSDRLKKDEKGAPSGEQGLMVGLIAVAIIAAVILLPDSLTTLVTDVSEEIPAVPA